MKKGPQFLEALDTAGVPRGIRTPDPLIRSQILYPTELWVQKMKKLEAALGFEPGVKELQSSALPLGYAASIKKWGE